MFLSCVKMDVISILHLSLYMRVFLLPSPMQCTFDLIPLEHIAWPQEEAPCGGPFLSEAITF